VGSTKNCLEGKIRFTAPNRDGDAVVDADPSLGSTFKKPAPGLQHSLEISVQRGKAFGDLTVEQGLYYISWRFGLRRSEISSMIPPLNHPSQHFKTIEQAQRYKFSAPQVGRNPIRSSSVPSGSPNNVGNSAPSSRSVFSRILALSLCWSASNAFEARFFHHFIVHCADWKDVCDPRQHFENKVPRRAAHYPVILNGILWLASRHL